MQEIPFEDSKLSEEKYGWIKPLRFIGIMLFVMVPFQGSGGLVGSIVGRLIGMKPRNTFLAIALGAIIGCMLIAFFAQAFLVFAEINTTLTILLVLVLALIALLVLFRKKLHLKKELKRPEGKRSMHKLEPQNQIAIALNYYEVDARRLWAGTSY